MSIWPKPWPSASPPPVSRIPACKTARVRVEKLHALPGAESRRAWKSSARANILAPWTSDDAPLKGAARIAAYLKTLPDAPGVYRMLNAAGDVLYVGKAKSLKKRVASYAQRGGHNDRITRMIAETAEMLFVTTASETEALLLESNLIKRLKPRYNVSYRDDKSFPNILLREDHPFPQLLKHRGAKTHQGRLFRALRQRRRGHPHAQHLAARLPAALLFGFGVRQPHPALPAVPDQALQRALRRSASTQAGYGELVRGGGEISCPAKAARCRTSWSTEMNDSLRGAGFRSAPRGCATGCAR